MTGLASRIRGLRERLGMSQGEMAALLDMTDMSYFDLEVHDDELEAVPSLDQVRRLAAVFGITTAELVAEPAQAAPAGRIRYVDLVDRMRSHVNAAGLSMAEFEDQVGWALEDFLASEHQALRSYNLDFLKDLCSSLGLDWREALP
jgi:DNA-binding XRE family transcriptional regulator